MARKSLKKKTSRPVGQASKAGRKSKAIVLDMSFEEAVKRAATKKVTPKKR